MAKLHAQTIFSDPPAESGLREERNEEKGRVSYWLKKLHTQREQIREVNKQNGTEAVADADMQEFAMPSEGPEQVKAGALPLSKEDLTQSGIAEHAINIATKKEDDAQVVDDLVRKSNRCIISITSTFPWDFFPNTIDVEESRVNFKFSQLFASQSHSVDIKDISNVFIESSLFFSSLQVVSRTFNQNDIKIGFLNTKKAKKVKSVIEGLRTFAENDINTSNYEIEELVAKIGEFHTNTVS